MVQGRSGCARVLTLQNIDLHAPHIDIDAKQPQGAATIFYWRDSARPSCCSAGGESYRVNGATRYRPDDVIYRAFFASHRQKGRSVRCTVVGKKTGHEGWFGPDRFGRIQKLRDLAAVEVARDLLGPDNVRFYGGGVPNVFLDGGKVTDGALERLLGMERALSVLQTTVALLWGTMRLRNPNAKR